MPPKEKFTSNKLLEIEQVINSLSLDEQKWLVKRLSEKVKQNSNQILAESNIENQIELMASDLELNPAVSLCL